MVNKTKLLNLLKTVLITGVSLIILTNVIFYAILQQDKSTDFTYFKVCIIQDNISKLVRLDEYNKLAQKPQLCDVGSVHHLYPESSHYVEIQNLPHQSTYDEWLMTLYTGSPGEPIHYRYRTDSNGNIEPLWHQKGDWLAWFMSAILSIFVLYLLSKVYRKIKAVRHSSIIKPEA